MEKDRYSEYAPSRSEGQTDKHRDEKKASAVGASELAQMGVCERLMLFEHRYGKRRTPRQQEAITRGQEAHGQFYRESVLISKKSMVTLLFAS